MNLGENIKKRREELKLSQEYVAEQLGITRQAVSKWETGQSEPTASNLIQLADVFEIGLSELVHPEKTITEVERGEEQPDLNLHANLTRTAIAAQAAFLYSCTQVVFQLRHSEEAYRHLYRGELIFFLVLLALASAWMAVNHRYEQDKNQRRKNIYIELVYCCIQTVTGLFTIRFGMGLVGLFLIIIVYSIYVLYINPKFMSRKLTK